ncbi:non-reducing end alpha-L-arabinofuranosidase family hydrolase [Sphingomonas sp. LB-2]|uniref:non-reducing end alpha-L-arabinofuranosidase family hydrolase n=1 Tax=Sphingomonas caeni TaxID=2984949 RepID=UPI00222F46AB|nr:non-reducing end alpha-L-arabinofuranosidase family hydrolase [Sphingomonas caeni]MCW3849503.1 non-reducing end alpha-L-arabinofuranosidase family hydrolase [Sphingomonas caeni]
MTASCGPPGGERLGGAGASPPALFRWASSQPLILPKPDANHAIVAVKDPSIVHADGKYHVFMTTAGAQGWGLAYASFRDWDEAPSAPLTFLDTTPIGGGYHAAPQVFYFGPQGLWYMVFQGGDPFYSTTRTIGDPMSWSAPRPLFEKVPDAVKGSDGRPVWLDFWVICDTAKCYLFNTGDNGRFYRSETTLGAFPHGFTNTRVVLEDQRDRLFEASMTYRVAGTDSYVTMIEAIGPQGRYFRSWTSDRLDGSWTPLAGSVSEPFAGPANVSYEGRRWSMDISHGEMIREGNDQNLTIDPCKPLRFLYQGYAPGGTYDYINLPYRLGLITAKGPNPLSMMCRSGSDASKR